jgi:DNA-binding CsgD family transcriptional regulator/FtsZ-binding cell division protein ZapB
MKNDFSEILRAFAKEPNNAMEEITTLRREIDVYKEKYEETRRELSESEIALEALTKNFIRIKFDNQNELAKRIASEVLPLLNELTTDKISDKTQAKLEVIATRLKMIMPSPSNPYSILKLLSPMEVRIASMITDGYKSKEIASLLNISLDTVKTHRRGIRKKLKLNNKQIGLSSYLRTILPPN